MPYQPLFTVFRTPQRMRYVARPAVYQREAHTEVRTQSLRGSYQVEGDLLTQSQEMYARSLEACALIPRHQKAKFVAIMLDPPWSNSAFELNYATVHNE